MRGLTRRTKKVPTKRDLVVATLTVKEWFGEEFRVRWTGTDARPWIIFRADPGDPSTTSVYGQAATFASAMDQADEMEGRKAAFGVHLGMKYLGTGIDEEKAFEVRNERIAIDVAFAAMTRRVTI